MDDGTSAQLTDENEMNVKQGSSWLPALAVGIVISVVQLYVAKQSDRGDTLVKVETQLNTLVKQFDDFSKRDFVRRDDFDRELNRVDKRIDALEARRHP